jgi:hypothetical protein
MKLLTLPDNHKHYELKLAMANRIIDNTLEMVAAVDTVHQRLMRERGITREELHRNWDTIIKEEMERRYGTKH